jgi:hypothetical protein
LIVPSRSLLLLAILRSYPFVPSLRLLLLLAIHRSRPFVPSLSLLLLLVIHRSRPFVPSLSLLLLLVIHRSRPFVPSLSMLPLVIRRSRPFVRPTNVNPAWHCCNIQTREREERCRMLLWALPKTPSFVLDLAALSILWVLVC